MYLIVNLCIVLEITLEITHPKRFSMLKSNILSVHKMHFYHKMQKISNCLYPLTFMVLCHMY